MPTTLRSPRGLTSQGSLFRCFLEAPAACQKFSELKSGKIKICRKKIFDLWLVCYGCDMQCDFSQSKNACLVILKFSSRKKLFVTVVTFPKKRSDAWCLSKTLLETKKVGFRRKVLTAMKRNLLQVSTTKRLIFGGGKRGGGGRGPGSQSIEYYNSLLLSGPPNQDHFSTNPRSNLNSGHLFLSNFILDLQHETNAQLKTKEAISFSKNFKH